MGHEFFGTFSSQEATLQPNYWLMGLAAAPTFLVAVLELAVAILALTDGRLTSLARYSWALVIVIVPMVGALAYLIVRGKERLCQHRHAKKHSRMLCPLKQKAPEPHIQNNCERGSA